MLFDWPGRRYRHRHDGVFTRNIDGFMANPRFRRAYDRAVAAAGWDYDIPWRIHQALWCSHIAQKVDGDFVEVGTGRGFIMSAVLADFNQWTGSGRHCHLFDTFKSASLGPGGEQLDTNRPSPHYARSLADVERNFSEWPRVHLHAGDVFDTISSLQSEKIAFLHVDLNYYAPEIHVLRFLWPRISMNGVVLLDDYANEGREEQFRAMNQLSEELDFDILSTPTGQGIILK
jgi:hypothetical protein